MNLPNTFSKDKKQVNVIIETTAGSRNKFEYIQELKIFKLSKILPFGMSFPLNMGFIPGTKGGDGDPLDVLIMMDNETYQGCLVECRILGVIEATQKTKHGKPYRNDRFIAVPSKSYEHYKVNTIKDLDKNKLDDIIHFFIFYNKMENKRFKVLDIRGAKAALKSLKKCIL